MRCFNVGVICFYSRARLSERMLEDPILMKARVQRARLIFGFETRAFGVLATVFVLFWG